MPNDDAHGLAEPCHQQTPLEMSKRLRMHTLPAKQQLLQNLCTCMMGHRIFRKKLQWLLTENVENKCGEEHDIATILCQNNNSNKSCTCRASLQDLCSLKPCAVCSMEVPATDVKEYSIKNIPHVQLLSVDGPIFPTAPRSGKTTYCLPDKTATFCMQPAACREDKADVCTCCYKALASNCLPEHSLVCYDAGGLPQGT